MGKKSDLSKEVKKIYLKQLKRNKERGMNFAESYSNIYRCFSESRDFDTLESQQKVLFVKFIIELGLNRRISLVDYMNETYKDLYFLFINSQLVLDVKKEMEDRSIINLDKINKTVLEKHYQNILTSDYTDVRLLNGSFGRIHCSAVGPNKEDIYVLGYDDDKDYYLVTNIGESVNDIYLLSPDEVKPF